jgi:hypothetical protein
MFVGKLLKKLCKKERERKKKKNIYRYEKTYPAHS